MNWTKNKTVGVFALIITVITLNSCAYQDPEVTSFEGIEVISMENNLAEIDLNFSMNNPNNQNIKLNEAEFEIMVNATYLGKAVLKEPVILPKNGVHPLKLHMVMEMDKSVAEVALSLGLAVLTNNINLKVNGTAKGSMGIFSRKFEINHSERIDWEDLKDLAK